MKGLTLLSQALMLYLRDHQLPMVGSALLISPWCDLTASLRSWQSNADLDYITSQPLPMDDSEAGTMSIPALYVGPEHYPA